MLPVLCHARHSLNPAWVEHKAQASSSCTTKLGGFSTRRHRGVLVLVALRREAARPAHVHVLVRRLRQAGRVVHPQHVLQLASAQVWGVWWGGCAKEQRENKLCNGGSTRDRALTIRTRCAARGVVLARLSMRLCMAGMSISSTSSSWSSLKAWAASAEGEKSKLASSDDTSGRRPVLPSPNAFRSRLRACPVAAFASLKRASNEPGLGAGAPSGALAAGGRAARRVPFRTRILCCPADAGFSHARCSTASALRRRSDCAGSCTRRGTAGGGGGGARRTCAASKRGAPNARTRPCAGGKARGARCWPTATPIGFGAGAIARRGFGAAAP